MSTKAASKIVKQLAGSGTGQSLMDRVTQAKFSLAGSGLGKVVAKATTEEIGPPKKKHIDYLVNCSNEPNVSIPLLAGLLVERAQEKSLLQGYGFRFLQSQAGLLKALPVLSSQITVLLEFEVAQKDLNNSIINCAFLLLYKDLIRLFASYNEGMINLIEKYFTLKRSQCRVGLDLYHGFPEVQAKITDFLTLAESMGIGDRDSLGLQPVPPKVIQAMEQHLAILESKKGSDDDDESTAEGRVPTRPTAPKKPALPVPIPTTVPASPQKPPIPRSPERAVTPKKLLTEAVDQSQTQQDTPRSADEAEVRLDQFDDEPIETSTFCPTVVVNDEDGLPSALQEEIIAAATSHFTDTIAKSNEAVKRSAQQTAVVSPVIHTQLGRSEQRTVPIRPSASVARSQSPSPTRVPSHSPRSEPRGNQMNSASDGELEEINQHAIESSIDTKRNLSLLGLNERPHHGSASPICGSPFAADEKDVEPASGPPAWPEVPDDVGQSDFTTSFNAPTLAPSTTIPAMKQTTHHSALDDLLGLDLMSTDVDEPAGIMPTPASAATPQSSDKVNNFGQKPSGFGLDDLLALDPLLHRDEIASAVTTADTTPSTGSVLPAGLKQVNPTVPIRPAVSSTTQNKNPLDALDTTLVNLASSLGGQQGWGSSNPKKRPLKNQTKTGS